jgi:MazG family protein
MARLRDPEQGCPWDLKQDFKSLVPYTIEEAYEVAEAIEEGDQDEIKKELGDLLFQIVFYAQLGKEENRFDFEDIAAAISDKMVSRHPHVFDGQQYDDEEALHKAWQEQKEREKQAQPNDQHSETSQQSFSLMSGISKALPAMTRALKIQKRAAYIGFDWQAPVDVMPKILEELAELTAVIDKNTSSRQLHQQLEEEMGDLLFSCVNLARKLHIDPEKALRLSNSKFSSRFQKLEQRYQFNRQQMESASMDELEKTWQQIKQE